MATTREQIRGWLRQGQRENATHMLVLWDTFDGPSGNYPVYVKPGEDPREVNQRHCKGGGIKFVECYSYGVDLEVQLAANRVSNFEPISGRRKLIAPAVHIGRYHKGMTVSPPQLDTVAVGRLLPGGWEIEQYFSAGDYLQDESFSIALAKAQVEAAQLVEGYNRALGAVIYFIVSAYSLPDNRGKRLYFEDCYVCGGCNKEIDAADAGYCEDCTREQVEAGTRCAACDEYPLEPGAPHECSREDDDDGD